MYKHLLKYSIILILFLSACSFQNKSNKIIFRLGYMPNVTHATALVGIEKNIFKEALGSDVNFKPMHFVVGNNIIDAFITNQIDIAYVGPGPFINALYRKIPIKLLSNAASGGSLIVGAIHELPLHELPLPNGARIAVPQYGNTQDLILRAYLEKNNLDKKFNIIALPPQDTGTAFFTMSIDAACLPEPWGTILIQQGSCKLLVDEKEILNNGDYPVTVLVVSKKYAENNKDVIQKLLVAHKRINSFIRENPDEAVNIVQKAISNISKKQIDRMVIAESFKRCSFKDELNLKILTEIARAGIKARYYNKGFTDEISFN